MKNETIYCVAILEKMWSIITTKIYYLKMNLIILTIILSISVLDFVIKD